MVAAALPHDGEIYQTLLVGHFHKLLMTPRLIMNGCTKGFDEYSLANNFAFEVPQQALWMTHEKYGINHYMPVLCDEPSVKMETPAWIEWKANDRRYDTVGRKRPDAIRMMLTDA
jgi:hypothetical protein